MSLVVYSRCMDLTKVVACRKKQRLEENPWEEFWEDGVHWWVPGQKKKTEWWLHGVCEENQKDSLWHPGYGWQVKELQDTNRDRRPKGTIYMYLSSTHCNNVAILSISIIGR